MGIANRIHEERQKYNPPLPAILVGDTNQFCMAAEMEAIKYLKGEEGNSPVTFTDAIAQDKGSSYDGGCRIDFILASKGDWARVDSSIDREGMGVNGQASDHAALMAELVPLGEPPAPTPVPPPTPPTTALPPQCCAGCPTRAYCSP